MTINLEDDGSEISGVPVERLDQPQPLALEDEAPGVDLLRRVVDLKLDAAAGLALGSKNWKSLIIGLESRQTRAIRVTLNHLTERRLMTLRTLA